MIYENPIVAAGAVERNAKVQTFVRFAIAKGLSKGHDSETMTIFESRWPRSIHLAEMRSVQKSTVAPMNTIDSSSAAPLAALKPFGDAFIEYLRPQTVIGRMQGFRTIPFNTRVGRATAGSSVSWSGQGVSAILGTISFDSIIWKIRSIRGICVFTRELAKLADPSAEQLIRQDLANATAAFMDQQFLDPNVSEVTDISPASITNGATEIASTGATLAAISADLSNLLAQLTTNFSNVYLIMKPSTALGISKLSSGSGGAAFPNLGAYGGIIWGIPVIVSDNVPADANSPAHKMIVAIDAAEIFLNDAGIELEASEQALLEMSTSPDSPRTASTTLVSLWQQNLIAVLVRRYVNWARRREGSVAILTGVPF
jgi:HK97 family phage major capsid protein